MLMPPQGLKDMIDTIIPQTLTVSATNQGMGPLIQICLPLTGRKMNQIIV